jgi:CMP-N-acetylneuraminic acid synthetase
MTAPYVFAVIPARGGSKRLPRKNLLRLGPLSLLGHAVASAREATTLSRFIVSTDSVEIVDEARRHGAEPPFLRPAELATDEPTNMPVLQHAVRWLEAAEGIRADVVVTLQPTSPFRTGADIDRVVRKLLEANSDSAQSLKSASYHPFFMSTLDGDRAIPLFPDWQKRPRRRRDATEAYQPSGAVYATRYDVLMKHGRITGDDNRAVVLGFEASISIDTEWDFKLAELILQAGRAPIRAERTRAPMPAERI